MSDSGSLSRVEPNLMNCGSLTFLNLSFVVLSKHRTMLSMSSINAESERWSTGGSHSILKECNISRKLELVTFKELTGVDADENWSMKMTLQTTVSEDSTSDKSLTLGRRNFLKAILNVICTLAVSADVESSASCVYDNDTLSCLEEGRFKENLVRLTTYLHCICWKAVLDREVKTGLSFCNKRNTGTPMRVVGDKTCNNCGLSHLTLLGPFPPIGMRKDKVNIVFEGLPQCPAVRMGFLNVTGCTLE